LAANFIGTGIESVYESANWDAALEQEAGDEAPG
jgi:hypothetical protein